MSRIHPVPIALLVAALFAAGATPAIAGAPSGPVIVQGVAYDANGSTTSPGQAVTLTAWPNAATLAALPDGASVPTLVAGTAVTDAAGSFALRYSDPAALAAYADSSGVVNFNVESASGGAFSTFAVSRTLSTALRGVTAEAQRSAPVDAISAGSIRLAPISGASLKSTGVKQAAAASVGCGWIKLSTLGPRWVQVGEGFTTTGVSAKFTYTSGASSTLGVGVSASGASGTFTASGTTMVASTLTIGMSPISNVAGRYWRTQFVYSKFRYSCPGGVLSYEVRATSFAGGAQNGATTAVPSVPYCTPQPANTHVTRKSSTASTVSAGARVSADIGINLSSKTGFTSSASITYTFSAAHKLCGANDYPGGSPGRLAAKP